MAGVNFTITWDPPLASRMSNLQAFMDSGVYESIGRLAIDAQEELLRCAQNAAPKRTGAYADAIRGASAVQGKGNKVTIYGPSPLSTFITGGTAPHVIQSTRARRLRWEDAGGVHFATKVNHPGTKANPFPEVALEDASDYLYERAADWGRSIVLILRAA